MILINEKHTSFNNLESADFFFCVGARTGLTTCVVVDLFWIFESNWREYDGGRYFVKYAASFKLNYIL